MVSRWRSGRSLRLPLGLVVTAAALVVTSPGVPAQPATRPTIQAYRGLGSWVDIYDPGQWKHPGDTVGRMARHGVRTLFLETGNYHSGPPIFHPGVVDRF